ncbi:MAG: IPT/TIG domain-containing protein [bacterium]|nr:IPT/TIG domain-containing protein [bacterium]
MRKSLTAAVAAVVVALAGCDSGGGGGGGGAPSNGGLALNAIVPSTGSPSGGEPVQLFGTSFSGGVEVLFTSPTGTALPLQGVAVNQAGTVLSGLTPPGVPGVYNISVRTPGGSLSELVGGFSYVETFLPPNAAVIFPAAGSEAGGESVQITGAYFTIGTTSVLIGGKAMTSVVVDSSGLFLTGITPANLVGVADVVVSTPNGTDVLFGAYTYVPSSSAVPSISGLSPSSGEAGDTVTLSGSNLGSPLSVSFGGVAGTILSSTTSQVRVAVPSGSGTVTVLFTSSLGSASSSFSYSATQSVALVLSSTVDDGGSKVTFSFTKGSGGGDIESIVAVLSAQPSGQGLGTFTDTAVEGTKQGIVTGIPSSATALRFSITAQVSGGGSLLLTHDRSLQSDNTAVQNIFRP